jgi:uncharacterized membrane protein YdfJ with MMPL/SSD domain
MLLVLATRLRLLHLGQTNVGALPESTQARQAYDRMTEGFGAGSNGPMLVAVALAKKATNDQQRLDKLKKQEADQKAKEQQQAQQQTAQLTQEITRQLVAQGVPPQQAQQQAEKQAQEQVAAQ